MAVVTNVTSDWSSAETLSSREFWQVRRGPLFVATGATDTPASASDGMLLSEGDIIALESGDVVRVRSARPDGAGSYVRRERV